jgi:type I restriction enzyme S subunit
MAGEDWPLVPLGELTENFDGRRVPVKENDRKPGPYPYYGASGIVDRVDGYLFDGEYLLIGEDGENLRTRQTPIAFMATGKFWVNNHAHIVRGNHRADTRFLSYVLSQTDISGYLTGSTMPKLTQGNLNRLPIISPPLAEQKAIAAVLGALDDKIELNRRMNGTLEAMARALFQSWFVDFDPVRAKLDGRKPVGLDEATAALFPASFQDSKLGPIPHGWAADTIKNRASNIQYGFTQSATKEPVGPHFLRITDISGGRIDWSSVPFCQATDEEREKYRIVDGDIFIARTGASTGDNIYAVEPPPAVFASYLIRIQFSSRGLGRLVGEFTRTADYASYVAGTIGGSAQPNASAQTLAGASLVFPTEEIADAFYRTVRPFDLMRAANDRESRTLANLRDTLLPKLLSGEIRVSDAEKSIEDAT